MVLLGLILFTTGLILSLIAIGTERKLFKILSICILFLFIGVTCFTLTYKQEKKIDIQEINVNMDSDGQYVKIKTYDNEYFYINTKKINEELERCSTITIRYLPYFYKTDKDNNKMFEIINIK